jgi:putative membrane protein
MLLTERTLVVLMIIGLVGHVGFHFAPPWFDDTAYAFTEASLALTVFCLASAAHLLGRQRALVFFGIAVILGWLSEFIGIRTGLVFGEYSYTDQLGIKLGGVPVIVPLVWFCIIYVTYVLANLIVLRSPRPGGNIGAILWLSLVGAFLTTAYDLVLDPFMVISVQAWEIESGSYFGETQRGPLGWLLISFLVALVYRLVDRPNAREQVDDAHVTAAAGPILAYGVWAVFFTIYGEPAATRLIAFISMGLAILAAVSGFAEWRRGRLANEH